MRSIRHVEPGDVYTKDGKHFVKAPEFGDFGPYNTDAEAWKKAWRYADWLENDTSMEDLLEFEP